MGAGITGPVTLKSAKSGSSIDLASQQWTYQVRYNISPFDLNQPQESLVIFTAPTSVYQNLTIVIIGWTQRGRHRLGNRRFF